MQYADVAELFTQHATVKQSIDSSLNDEKLAQVTKQLNTADQGLRTLVDCLQSVDNAASGDTKTNSDDTTALSREELIERCVSLAQAQHERMQKATADADALRRRLTAYEHIVSKEGKLTREDTAVGVAVAATSLMDDPSSLTTRNKILEYDLREATAERDKV